MQVQLVTTPVIDPNFFSTLKKAGIDVYRVDRDPKLRTDIQKVASLVPAASFYYSFLIGGLRSEIISRLGSIRYSVIINDELCLVYATASLEEWLAIPEISEILRVRSPRICESK